MARRPRKLTREQKEKRFAARRDYIVALARIGVTLEEIGSELNISKQRVHQILEAEGFSVKDIRPWKWFHYLGLDELWREIRLAGGVVPFAKESGAKPEEVREAMDRVGLSEAEVGGGYG